LSWKKRYIHILWGLERPVGSRRHKAQGIEIPKDEVMTEFIRFVAYHPHPRLIKLWLDGSRRVVDRLLDMPDVEGIK
jgi:hypothetical protein